jgi:MFS family permease
MIGVAYAFTVTMLGTTLPTPLYPIYQSQIHFSALIVTVVFATYGVGVLAALLLLGPLSDRFGRKRILLPGLALAALSSAIFLVAHGLPLLFVGRALSGLSAGVFTGTATAALLDLAPPDARRQATLIATVANLGGLGLGPLVAGALAQLAPDPLRLPYIVHLALLVPATAALLAIPNTGGGSSSAAVAKLSIPGEVRTTFIRAGTVAFAAFATMGLFTAVAPAFVAKVIGDPSRLLSGTVVFALFASSTIGQLSLERSGPERALPIGCVLMIVGTGLIAGALAARSLGLLVAGAVVAGFGTGLGFRAGLAAVNAQAPAERRGELNSSYFVVAYLALSVPIIGVGVATEAFGLRPAALVFNGCVALLALGVLLSLRGSVSSGRRGPRPGKLRTEATEGSRGSP